MMNEAHICLQLFEYFEKSQVEYCLLGNPDKIFSDQTGDIDIAVDQKSFNRLDQYIYQFSKLSNTKIAQKISHETSSCFYVLWWVLDDQIKFLQLDICSDYIFHGRLQLSSSYLISNRSKYHTSKKLSNVKKSFYVLNPRVEFEYYLLKKILKKQFNSCHGAHLHFQWKNNPGAINSFIKSNFDDDLANLLYTSIKHDNWNLFIDNFHLFYPKYNFSVLAIIRKCYRLILRTLYPTGFTVAFLGPDGSGKSTLIDSVYSTLSPFFRSQKYFHLRPRIISNSQNNSVVINPYNKPTRNSIFSIAKLLLFISDFWVGFILKVYPAKICSNIIIFDRYYHDIKIDPRRYRYGGSKTLLRISQHFIPKPDAWIVLNAPPKVINSRKQEVSLPECQLQCQEYAKFSPSSTPLCVVQTDRTIQESTLTTTTFLLSLLSERTIKRLAI